MNSEIFFLILFFIPLCTLGILMSLAQQKFLRSYRRIVKPKKLVYSEEILSRFLGRQTDKEKQNKITIKDLKNYPYQLLKLLWRRYDNAQLEKKASRVRVFMILTAIIPLLGFALAAYLSSK